MRPSRSLSVVLLLAAAGMWLGFGCSGDDNNSSGTSSGTTTSSGSTSSGTAGGGTGGTGTGGNASTSTSSGSSTGGMPPLVEIECQGHLYECGDTIDNDMDGVADAYDSDCLGPCDNTEDSYFPGIPGLTGPGCDVDCFFDQDSGSGNDDCYWDHGCDTNETPPNYYPEWWLGNTCEYDPNTNISGTSATCDELYQAQSQECYDYCGPLTPNGCDCFGCCELPSGSGQYVWLGTEDGMGNGACTQANINDPQACSPCLPVAACLNECGHCELCIGKDELPPDCTGQGGGGTGGDGQGGGISWVQCPPGVQKCGLPGQPACPGGSYCISGCCQIIPD
jgi:hypothetical protein